MALATLTIDVVAKVADLERDMGKMARDAERSAKRIQGAFKAAGIALSSLGVGAGIAAIVRASAEQERVVAELESRIKSTGGVAGYSSQQLQDMASALQQVTRFGDDAIIPMQSLLLTFTNIRGPVFEQASEAILNLATTMGTDLKSAALQVGKALNDPVKGVSALAEAGIQFTDSQRDTIKALVETGDVAAAQGIILKELETQFGGAARAARDTFAGALTAVQNAAGDLLEGDGGNLVEAKAALEELAQVLQDPATKEAAAALVAALARLVGVAAEGATEFANLGQQIGAWAAAATGNLSPLDELELKIKDVDRALENSLLGKPVQYLFTSEEELTKLKAKLEAERDALLALLRGESGGGNVSADEFDRLDRQYQGEARQVALDWNVNTDSAQISEDDFQKLDQQLQEQAKAQAVEQAALNTELERQAQHWRDLVNPVNEYQRQLEELERLKNAGKIDDDAYAEAIFNVMEKMDALGEKSEDTFGQMNEYARAAAEGMQSAFADFFFDAMEGNLSDLGDAFTNIIKRMVAEMLAAQAAMALFGDYAKTGQMGGLVGAVMSYGGGKASGGPVSAGSFYEVNERGPELLTVGGRDYLMMGANNGKVTPASMGGGVTQHITIDARGAAPGTEERIHQAMGEATRQAYAAVLHDLQTNGPIRQSMGR